MVEKVKEVETNENELRVEFKLIFFKAWSSEIRMVVHVNKIAYQ